MIKSMTGFGRAELSKGNYNFVVEMKSVNNRYNDIIIKLPKVLKIFEEDAKKLVKDKVKRGRVEVFVTYTKIGESEVNIKADLEIAKQYKDALEKLRDELNLEGQIKLENIVRYPEVIISEKAEEDIEVLESLFLEVTKEAVKKLSEMRQAEGNELYQDLIQRKNYIEEILEKIEVKGPKLVVEHKTKLKERIKELIGEEIELDEIKLLNEVAYFADKSNITEEIVRLKSHFIQFEKILNENDAVGRKLDFLIQEMNRETNTMGSKVQDLDITNLVIEIKSELEKIREQVQNIE